MNSPRIGASPQRPQGAEETLCVLNVFAVSLLKQNRLEDLFWSIAENVGTLLGFEDCVIYVARAGVLHQAATFGLPSEAAKKNPDPIRIPTGQGVVGHVAESGHGLVVRDTATCNYYVSVDVAGRSEICVPVVYQGRVLAVIDSESTEIDAFNTSDLRFLTSVANIAAPRIASALEEDHRRKVEEELKHANEELEARVEKRTAALASSVCELEAEVSERRRVERTLESESRLLRLTLHAVGDGLYATDAEGRVVLASDAALRMTNVSREYALGQQLGHVYRTFDTSEDGMTVGAQSESPRVAEIVRLRSSTKALRYDDGEVCLLDEVVGPIRDSNGETIGLVVVFRDVTLERALERKAQRSHRMESIGVLAGGIAHDFNNLLTTILGRINLAQAGHDNEHVLANALAEAEAGCLNARGLTKELLAFAKGGSPVKSTASIRDLILNSVRLCLHGSSVEARLDLDDDLPCVEMDSVQVAQALNNLILNAAQAMPNGGAIRITARNERPPGHASQGAGAWDLVVITIQDAGSGISANAAERIFDPYYTTKDTHSGLGLATSERIVQRHGGQLRLLESAPHGSSFEIRLPVSTARETIRSATPITGVNGDPRGNVLLMDDDPAVREAIAAMLRRIGMSVTVASNGEEAIGLCESATGTSGAFDVTLLDLTVRGGMGGLKALQHLHAIDPDMKAIVISGYSDDRVLANHGAHGFDGRLEKPFTLGQLREVIAQVVPSH